MEYRNDISTREDRHNLKLRIKGIASDIRELRNDARDKAQDKDDRQEWYNESKVLGRDARHLLLAYAFLRGRHYKQVERTCREEPSAYEIRACLPKRETPPKKVEKNGVLATAYNLLAGKHQEETAEPEAPVLTDKELLDQIRDWLWFEPAAEEAA